MCRRLVASPGTCAGAVCVAGRRQWLTLWSPLRNALVLAYVFWMGDGEHSGVICDVQKSQESGGMVNQDHYAQKILRHVPHVLWLWVFINAWGRGGR